PGSDHTAARTPNPDHTAGRTPTQPRSPGSDPNRREVPARLQPPATRAGPHPTLGRQFPPWLDTPPTGAPNPAPTPPGPELPHPGGTRPLRAHPTLGAPNLGRRFLTLAEAYEQTGRSALVGRHAPVGGHAVERGLERGAAQPFGEEPPVGPLAADATAHLQGL